MKTVFAVIGAILLIVISGFIGANYFKDAQTTIAFSDSPIKEVGKLTLVEFTRSWNKTIQDSQGAGTGIIEYQWQFTYMFGIDVPKNWDWKINQNGKEVTMRAPKLTLLNKPAFSVDDTIVFNKASGKRLSRMNKKAKVDGEKAIKDGATEAKRAGGLVSKHAKLALQDFMLNLLNQANPDLPITKIQITFAK